MILYELPSCSPSLFRPARRHCVAALRPRFDLQERDRLHVSDHTCRLQTEPTKTHLTGLTRPPVPNGSDCVVLLSTPPTPNPKDEDPETDPNRTERPRLDRSIGLHPQADKDRSTQFVGPAIGDAQLAAWTHRHALPAGQRQRPASGKRGAKQRGSWGGSSNQQIG